MIDRTAWQTILQVHQIAYIVADPDLRAVEIGGVASMLDGDGSLGYLLPDLIPELVGCESLLYDLLNGDLPILRIDQINREAPPGTVDGNIRYLTLTIRRIKGNRLLAILADTTAQGRYMQMITQQRNELALLQRQLLQTNTKLDYLLRHYLPAEVADALLERRLLPQPGGELRTVSVLFADLGGYSQVAGQLSPTQTMAMVNHYLTIACDAIAEAGGTVTQFMGDAVMALFNAPNDQPDHAWRAVQAGLDIQQRMADQENRPGAGLPHLHFGVGIHSGPAVVGNTGTPWRYDYSAIGDTTNIAFRICGLARAGEVLIGPTTRQQVGERVGVTALAPVRFKGKRQPLTVFRVNGLFEKG